MKENGKKKYQEETYTQGWPSMNQKGGMTFDLKMFMMHTQKSYTDHILIRMGYCLS